MIVGTDGIAHPTLSDEVTPWGNAHISCCPFCMPRFGGGTLMGRPIPVEDIGIPPAPTGRAKHRKEDQ